MSELGFFESWLDAVILKADGIARDAGSLARSLRSVQGELGKRWPEEHPCGDAYEVPARVTHAAQQMAEHLEQHDWAFEDEMAPAEGE